ncbi:MAG: hypothetical protein GTN67_04235 [Hydrotalea flava]|uniref:heavy-metal-associated domain-containing protein n=1 Tax=Hydrotalea TaxID=1004300 RepID=UPI0009BFE56D|nr:MULTISPECIES: heavy metal-associated domain-containing protein [Hydrotalea]NIM34647.1 hypothetical protein [Hydrotalea flava]NIM37489.1 hypothetical protein [Hydrotalea flava]NIN02657.1 hypothetical protein [Hydrotalea flava]NIN14332.1 hypothetical protein [Hydrotalea flava]NIO93415.1 hypothetical protein [Hydrotalea flava]
MLKIKLLHIKELIPCIVIIALSVSSCVQQQKQDGTVKVKEQRKTVVMQKVKMPVDGMTCSACQSNVKHAIKSIDGVSDVEVNLEKRYAYFTYDPQKVKVDQIQKAVNDKGYKAGNPQEVKQ